jgi:putative DNA primase/helicase
MSATNQTPSQEQLDKLPTVADRLKLIQPKLYEPNERDISRVFAMATHRILRFNTTHQRWMVYNGRFWELDQSGVLSQRVMREFSLELAKYISINSTSIDDAFFKYVLSLGSFSKRKSLLKDASDINIVDDSDFDNDVYLFNCKNGTLNLRTATLQPFDPEDMITKIANVRYIPNATNPDWDKFMQEIFSNDQELINYMYEVFGYTLSGLNNQECFWILRGETTRNGKSTLLGTFAYMLGSTNGYYKNMDISSLAKKNSYNSSRASSDIARLRGARFVTCNEPNVNFELDENKIKEITGNDTITARMLYSGEEEFAPTFKIFIACNNKVSISDESIIISKRMKIIPFKRHFGDNQQNKMLKTLLKEDSIMEAFLWKCVEGYTRMAANGFTEPASVASATADFESAGQIFDRFLDDKMIKNPNGGCSYLAQFYPIYDSWCTDNGFVPMGKDKVNSYLKAKGLWQKSGTFPGGTKRNVLVGYSIPSEAITIPAPQTISCQVIQTPSPMENNRDISLKSTGIDFEGLLKSIQNYDLPKKEVSQKQSSPVANAKLPATSQGVIITQL